MLDKKTVEAFEEYENLKIKTAEIAEKLDELRPVIMPHVPIDKEVAGAHGVFYIQERTKWKYSPELEQRKKDLKKDEGEAQAKGEADKTSAPTLYYKINI